MPRQIRRSNPLTPVSERQHDSLVPDSVTQQQDSSLSDKHCVCLLDLFSCLPRDRVLFMEIMYRYLSIGAQSFRTL